jgi:hypothetical protein
VENINLVRSVDRHQRNATRVQPRAPDEERMLSVALLPHSDWPTPAERPLPDAEIDGGEVSLVSRVARAQSYPTRPRPTGRRCARRDLGRTAGVGYESLVRPHEIALPKNTPRRSCYRRLLSFSHINKIRFLITDICCIKALSSSGTSRGCPFATGSPCHRQAQQKKSTRCL